MTDNVEEELNKNNSIEIKKKEEPKKEKRKSQENINLLKNDKSQAKIIDELPKNELYDSKKIKTAYRLVFVFRNEDVNINVKPETKLINVFKKISAKINMPLEKIYINYNDRTLTEKDYETTVKKFFDFPKNKSRPILYVRLKSFTDNSASKYNYLNNSSDAINKSNYYSKTNYSNKVKISNYPSLIDINVSPNDDIHNIINSFLKESKINSDFYVERKEEQKEPDININTNESNILDSNILETSENVSIIYIVGFPTPDVAFDFNRYMSILKLVNPTFKNIKIKLLMNSRKSSLRKNNQYDYEEQKKCSLIGIYSNVEATNPEEKNIKVIAKIRDNFINNQMYKMNNMNMYRYGYLNSASPYITPYDEVIKEKHENKKRWLNPRGFISSVNKYSGINL
jgi:hypothetical protein